MSLVGGSQLNEPTYELQFNKKQAPKDLEQRLIHWEVEDCEKVDKIKLVFDNHDLALDDLKELEQGSLVMFRHGYLDDLSKHKYFTISQQTGWKELTVEGMEPINIFNMDSHYKVWKDANLETVVGDVADRAGLKHETQERKNVAGNVLTFDYYQPMVEDMAFLYTLGRRIGYEVWVEDDTLYFMPRKYGQAPYMEFTYEGIDGDVIDFRPQAKTHHKTQNKKKGGGIDLEKKQTFFYTEKGETKRTVYLNKHMWDFEKLNNRYQDIKGLRQTIIPMRNKKEAEDVICGKYAKQMEDQITAELTLVGQPYLTARRVVNLKNFSKWSGKYYVLKVHHSGGHDGYTSKAELTRNAAFDDGAKYSRKISDTMINKERPSEGEFKKQTRQTPKWKYYEGKFQ